MSDELVIERRGPVTRLVIDRPDRGNALGAPLVDRLYAALQAATNDGTRLLVICANGRNFCSGFDLSSIDAESAGDLVLRFVRIEQVLQLLYHYPVDTVALARGRTYGAGADLFCVCNHRICTDDATFRFPGVRFGVVLGTRRLAARVGDDAAAATLLQGRELNASEAVKIGLATAQLPEAEWDGLVDRLSEATQSVTASTTQTVLDCLRADTRDADMASLVASVSDADFKRRISAYRDRVTKRT